MVEDVAVDAVFFVYFSRMFFFSSEFRVNRDFGLVLFFVNWRLSAGR